MNKLQWFKFSPTDWVMGKIQRCSEITQLRYLRLCCLYWNKECVLSYEDAEIEIESDFLKELISKRIVKNVDEFISISFLNEQFLCIVETSEKRRNAVKERWNKQKKTTTIEIQNDTSVLQIDTDKSRVEKDKRIKDISQREIDFKDKCRAQISTYGEPMIKAFFNYWSEATPDGKKMRFELQKTFEVSKRLVTWKNNNNKFTSATEDKTLKL